MHPLNTHPTTYQGLIGVGGIGSGSFFAVSGEHTLGREESRGGRFLDRRDYCKLHIISHYVKALLGPAFPVCPIGRVGDDAVGKRLLAEMAEAGLEMEHVRVSPGDQTLFSFCFVYPDGSGGNLTTEDSACARVTPAVVAEAEPVFLRLACRGIALAVPEVPLEARAALLHAGTRHQLLRVASFTSAEMPAALRSGILAEVDLLALNADEAAVAAGASRGDDPRGVVEGAVARLRDIHAGMAVSITAGNRGSWCWDGSVLAHAPAFPAEVLSTAGAGDAHLAGVLAGRVAGLTLPEAQSLGALVAALSVTSPHTIHKGIDRDALCAFAGRCGAALPSSMRALLG